jgi:hypothetical protein
VKPDNNVDNFITFQKDEIYATTNAGFLTPLILDRVEIKDDLSLNILKVSNGSSAGASNGDVLTISGGNMLWSQPSASISCASFALNSDTGSLVAGTYHTITGSYTLVAGVGNTITNNNNGTFTINVPGIYMIQFTLAMAQTTGTYLQGARCRISKTNSNGTIELGQHHFFDSVAEMYEVFPSVHIIHNLVGNDVIILEGQGQFASFKALGISGTNNVRTLVNFIKLG